MNLKAITTRTTGRRIRSVALLATVALLCGGGCAEQENPHGFGRAEADAGWLAGTDRPATPKTLYAMTKILAAQGRDAEAEFVLNKILKQHPDFRPAYVALAESYMRRRQVDAAIDVLSAGLKIAPDDAVLLNDVGMCSIIKGDYARALEMFEQAAAAMPQDARYRGNMALVLGMMGRYDEALALYEQLLLPADAHHNLAVICEARKDQDRADKERTIAQNLILQAREK